MKTLRVCLYKDIPQILERESNYIYFAYDALKIYVGQNLYNNPFSITEKIPTKPIQNIIYILLGDGSVNICTDYATKKVATIEDNSQIELLKEVGSLFYHNNKGVYDDLTTRSLVTPFEDGIYQIVVSLPKGTVIDKDTLIAYNEETKMFEVIGTKDPTVLFGQLVGIDTSTISTVVSDAKISANVRISKAYDNIISALPDGIYASSSDGAASEEFEEFKSEFERYESSMTVKLNKLYEKIEDITEIIDLKKIEQKIRESLKEVYPEIDEAFEIYARAVSKLASIEHDVELYSDNKYDEAYEKLHNIVVDAINNPWENY